MCNVHAIRTSQKGRAPAAAKHNNALNSPDKINNLSLCERRKAYKNSRGWEIKAPSQFLYSTKLLQKRNSVTPPQVSVR